MKLIDEQVLKLGLDRYRQMRLQAIEERMIELNETFDRNRGMANGLTNYPWGKLDNEAIALDRLESIHQELLEMDLFSLAINFRRERRESLNGARRAVD